jgi:hypothetical protein
MTRRGVTWPPAPSASAGSRGSRLALNMPYAESASANSETSIRMESPPWTQVTPCIATKP